MVKSARAKRMEKHHKRNKGTAALNLVSLMDIFTILVFFLLVNSSDVETLPNAKDLQLAGVDRRGKSKGDRRHSDRRERHHRAGHAGGESGRCHEAQGQ